VAVLLGHDQDVRAWRRRHARGEVVEPTPYGYDLAGTVFEMRWADTAAERPVVRRIRERFVRTWGFDLIHVWRNRRLVRWADVVWTHTEREHLAVAALQALRIRRRTPVLAQSVWLWDRWPHLGRPQRALVRLLLRRHAVECTHSRENLAFSLQQVPGRRVILLPFGTTVPSGAGPEREASRARPLVLALGNDADRDWDLMRQVAEAMPDLDFRIASSRRSVRALPWPANAVCEPARSQGEIADLYRAATVVAVPLKANRHASGATTCVEATGAGRALVVTDTGGIADYVPAGTPLVAVGDHRGWIGALRAVVDDPPAVDPGFVRSHGLTQRDYVGRYVAVTRELLGRNSPDERIGAFDSAEWAWAQAE